MSHSRKVTRPRNIRNSSKSVSEPKNMTDPNDNNKSLIVSNVQSEFNLSSDLFKKDKTSELSNPHTKKHKSTLGTDNDTNMKETSHPNTEPISSTPNTSINDSIHAQTKTDNTLQNLEASIHNPHMILDENDKELAPISRSSTSHDQNQGLGKSQIKLYTMTLTIMKNKV